jgi:hypothetical protein
MIRPFPGGDQAGQSQPHQRYRAAQVHLDCLPPLVGIHVPHRAHGPDDACVVDEHGRGPSYSRSCLMATSQHYCDMLTFLEQIGAA